MAHLVYRDIVQCTPRDLRLTIRSAEDDHDETTIYVLGTESLCPGEILVQRNYEKKDSRRFASRGDLQLPHGLPPKLYPNLSSFVCLVENLQFFSNTLYEQHR